MPRTMLIRPALVLLTLLVPTLATAQGAPRSVGECERLKNDLAFNQCLAMFGPAAKNVAGGFTAGAASASASVATALAAIPPGIAAALPPVAETGRRGRRSRYTRHGRQSASFDTGGGSRQYRRHRRR